MLRLSPMDLNVENYETEREEDSRYRNNKHDFNCEGGNDSFITVTLFMF